MKQLWLLLTPSQQRQIIHYTPAFVGKLPYQLALLFLRIKLYFSFPSGTLSIWPRHSYVLGSFVPFVSDLDLTIFAKRPLKKIELEKLKQIVSTAKPIFPFLGELNFYAMSDLKIMVDCINSFELARDPGLRHIASKQKNNGSIQLAAAVFLLRALDSDATNLHRNPEARVKKWRQHLASVAKTLQLSEEINQKLHYLPINLDSILDFILDLCEFSKDQQAVYRVELQRYYEYRRQGLEPWQISDLSSLWIFSPHLMMYTQNKTRPKLLEHEKDFLLSQLEWELWGIATQFYLSHSTKNYIQHLKNMKALVLDFFPSALNETRIKVLLANTDQLLASWTLPPGAIS